uniref:Peptidase_M1 domain-containing protein n=1 Tax=Meloidogyne hapla TaxID=6305 RepID=A0A1I8BFL5_MELHA
MATYLLALVVSDFQYREALYNGIKIRVWSQISKLDHTSHALDVSVRSLQYFEDYFRIPYPLKKLDIFGVPSLRVAAMENWGLILCRQQNLVYTEGIQARRDKQFVTDWFGDLVTMEWWDDLWLNEGFATIMGMKAADYAENSTSRTSQLFYEHTVKAFRFDQVAHQAHALSYKISSVREVARRFDRITYLKAAAVLRMVEHTVGEDIFKEGLRSFLRHYKYKNARSDDLIRVLRQKKSFAIFFLILYNFSSAETNGKSRVLSIVNFSLSEFMDSWTYQTGFPLIQLIALNSTAVLANQVQFFYLQKPSPNPSLWKVPLFINRKTNGKTENSKEVLILERESVILPRYQIVDPKAHGYYRIQYDPETYENIICTLLTNMTSIDLASRARLLEDAFTIARTGLISFELAFKMSEYLTDETEYLPLLVFNNHLQHILLLLRNHQKSYLIRSFILEMLETQFHRLFSSHFINADISDTIREFAMVQLCQWNYPPCIGHSLREFSRVRSACRDLKMSDERCNKIPPELRGPIYSTAIRHGNIDDFDFLWSKYLIEEYDSERGRILSGLVGTTDIKLVELAVNRFIGNLRNTTLIGFNPEDFYAFLLKFVRSPILNDVVNSMKRNFRIFVNKIPNTLLMKVILTFITKWMSSESDLAELKEFENEHKKELTEIRLLDYLHEQITEIKANEDFVNKYAPDIFAYLEKRKDERNLGKQKIIKCQPLN